MDGKELVRALFDAYNRQDPDALDEIVADDYVLNGTRAGREALKAFYVTVHESTPDDHIEILDLIAEGDRVVARLEARGTVTGVHRLVGRRPPNPKKVTRGIYIFRIQDGRIAEAWDVWDIFGELIQLGLWERPSR